MTHDNNATHWVLGGALLLIGLFVVIALVLTRSQADTPSTLLDIDNEPPTISAVKLCSGTGNPSGCSHVGAVTLTGGTTTLYSISGTMSDPNGFSDIDTFEGRYYRSAMGAACAADVNNCYVRSYPATCTLASTSSTAGTFDCAVALEHYADATDSGSFTTEGAYPTHHWVVRAYAEDQANANTSLTATNEINSLRDLSACASINYGTLGNGSASSTGVACDITNDGNVDIDIEISGTAMTCTVGSIPVGNQLADITNGSYASMAASGTHDPYTIAATTYSDIVLNKRTAAVVTDDLYHTITVPFAVSGSCSGTNTISAVAEV